MPAKDGPNPGLGALSPGGVQGNTGAQPRPALRRTGGEEDEWGPNQAVDGAIGAVGGLPSPMPTSSGEGELCRCRVDGGGTRGRVGD